MGYFSGHPSVGIDDAAILLGVGRTLVKELVKRREIPSFMAGNRRLIKLTALEAFIDAREAGDYRKPRRSLGKAA